MASKQLQAFAGQEEDKVENDAMLPQDFTTGFQSLHALASATPHRGITSLAFANVLLPAQQSSRQRKKNPNAAPILQNCFGHSKPKQVLAILGPNMAAQTSLLEVLTGRAFAVKRLHSGTFTVNDTETRLFEVIRPGFVAREPKHVRSNTVREEMEFAFALRMPLSCSAQTRGEVIQDVITSLGLQCRAHTQIKHLNASELKRLAIGVELVSLPNVLLVDQPVSGADRKTDLETMQVLQRIAQLDLCQVIITLHAPLPEIFKAVSEHFMLLDDAGATMCLGNARQALEYMSSKARVNEDGVGTGDFLLLCAQYAKDTWPNNSSSNGKMKVTPAPQRRPLKGICVQLPLLARREFLYVTREWRWLLFRFLVVGLLLALISIIFLGGGKQFPVYNVGAHLASFVFPLLMLSIGSAAPLSLILFHFKQIVLRETVSNMYALAPALVCKFVSELIVNLALVTFGVCMLHFSVEWHTDVARQILAFFVLVESSCSYAFFFAAAISSAAGVVSLVCFMLGVQIMFLGLIAPHSTLPAWFSWVNYVCNVSWGFKALASMEFDQTTCASQMTCFIWLRIKESNWMRTEDVGLYHLAMMIFFVVYRVLGLLVFYKKVADQR